MWKIYRMYFFGVYKSIPVYVPEESIGLYKAAEGWDYFTNFLPLEDAPVVAVEETQAAAINIYADHGTIYCEGEVEFKVYNLIGEDVSAQNGSLKGLFIVLAGNTATKVLVK